MRVNFEQDTMLSKVRQRLKNNYCVIPLKYMIKNSNIHREILLNGDVEIKK